MPLTTAKGVPNGIALPPPPTTRKARPQGRTLWGQCWVPTPTPTAPGTHGSRNPGCRPRGQAVVGQTAPDTRRPSQRWQATPARDGPPPPLPRTAPTGHTSQRDSVGPPGPQIRAHSTWVTDPDSPPGGRAVGQGGARDLRRPSQRRKAPPPGDALSPSPQRATPARKGARCGAGAGSPSPQQRHPGQTGRGTPAAHPGGRAAGGGTAPDTRRPSQQWQATPPGDSPPPPPAAHSPPRACQPRGQCAGPHTSTAAPTAGG